MTTNHTQKNLHSISQYNKEKYTKALEKLLEHHHEAHPHDTDEHKSKREYMQKVVQHAKTEIEKGELTHEQKTLFERVADDIHEAEPTLAYITGLVTSCANALGFV